MDKYNYKLIWLYKDMCTADSYDSLEDLEYDLDLIKDFDEIICTKDNKVIRHYYGDKEK